MAGANLPCVAVESLIDRPISFSVFRPVDCTWSMDLIEASTLCCLAAIKQPRKILELGTYRGLTTFNLALNASNAEVFTIDISDRWVAYYYADKPEAARIRQYYGNTLSFDFSAIGGGVDFCLIDAGHSYEEVREDTRRVLPLLTDDAVLLWDDYGRADFMNQGEPFGVTRFVNRLRKTGVQVLLNTHIAAVFLTPERKRILSQIVC